MTSQIVIAHYHADISWVKNISIPYIVYSRSHKEYHYIANPKGYEATMYFTYIIEHYDKLPDKMMFIHGHKSSWHQLDNIDHIINNVNWDLNGYFSINNRDIYQIIQSEYGSIVEPDAYKWLKQNWYFFEEYLPISPHFCFYSCGQFVVDKNLVLRYPKKFYEYLLQCEQYNNLDKYVVGRLFEYTWHYLFTKNPIEPIYPSIYY